MPKFVLYSGVKNRITNFSVDAQNGIYFVLGSSNALTGMCIVNVTASVSVGGVDRTVTALIGGFSNDEYDGVDVCTIADGNVLHHIVADCTKAVVNGTESATVTFKDITLDNGVVTTTVLVPSNIGVVQYVGCRYA